MKRAPSIRLLCSPPLSTPPPGSVISHAILQFRYNSLPYRNRHVTEQKSSTAAPYNVGALTVKLPKLSRVTVYQIAISLEVLVIWKHLLTRIVPVLHFLNLWSNFLPQCKLWIPFSHLRTKEGVSYTILPCKNVLFRKNHHGIYVTTARRVSFAWQK